MRLMREAGYDELTAFQRRVMPFFFGKRDLLVDAEGERGKTAAYLLLILIRSRSRRRGIGSLILAAEESQAGRIYSEFKKLAKSQALNGVILAEQRNLRAEEGLLEKDPDVIIGTPQRVIVHIRRGHCDFSSLGTLVIHALEGSAGLGFFEDIQFIASKLPRRRQSIILGSHALVAGWEEGLGFSKFGAAEGTNAETGSSSAAEPSPKADLPTGIILRRPLILKTEDGRSAGAVRSRERKTGRKKRQEADTVDNEKEAAKEAIAEILRAIREEEDPDVLNAFRRYIRRYVPIYLRTYVAAYLLKRAIHRIEKTPEAFTTLFISVGKNRKVFPRDLVNLFMRNLNLRRSDIGEIKVLDNYSFMDISLDRASDAISRLSGKNFRGRRITVNLARKKSEEKS